MCIFPHFLTRLHFDYFLLKMPHLCLYCMPGRKLNEETMFPPKYCLQDFGHCGKVTQTKSSQDCHTTKRNIFICLAATQPFHRPANLLQVLIVYPYFRVFLYKKSHTEKEAAKLPQEFLGSSGFKTRERNIFFGKSG